MTGDIDLAGYVFTHEEWTLFDDDFRSELLDAADSIAESAAAQYSSAEA